MYENRFRNWFITINDNADCFNEISNIVANYRCEYAYILHNKDNEEQPHYHLLLLFENPRTFKCLKNAFVGAHIEPCLKTLSCALYLCHRTNDSISKYQYQYEDVISNFDYISYVGGYACVYQPFILEEFMIDLYSGNYTGGLGEIILKYGLDNYKKYRLVILDLLKDYESGLHRFNVDNLRKELNVND